MSGTLFEFAWLRPTKHSVPIGTVRFTVGYVQPSMKIRATMHIQLKTHSVL